MYKSLFNNYKITAFAAILFAPLVSVAQSPMDGFLMPNRSTCLVAQYSNSSWSEYWEGALKRSNGNIGTLKTEMYSLMGATGFSDNLTVFYGVPYVKTSSTQGVLSGQKGIQDLSLAAKYRFIQFKAPLGDVSLFGVAGVSTPLTNYVADFQPYSIGMGAKTATIRAVAHYHTRAGIYLTGEAGYTGRSSITVDRDAFLYNGKLYYSNKVPVPDVADLSARIGFRNKWIRSEVCIESARCQSGDNIRLQDMPFPTNETSMTTAGLMTRFNFNENVSVQGSAGKVLSGQNTGQATTYTAAFLYTFYYPKKQAGVPAAR